MQTDTLTINTDPQKQFSSFLMDHLKPITMRKHWDIALKRDAYIQPLIQITDFIISLGDKEHTGDWDPSISIQYWDQTRTLQTLETEPGYYLMTIQGDNLLLKDTGDTTYEFSIGNIHSIQLIRNQKTEIMENTTFTTTQILHSIANWQHEPFNLEELNYLLKSFTGPKTHYQYGSTDIESFILETLSEMDC